MYGNNFRAQKVSVHDFTMVPRAEIPRSTFRMQQQHKTTIAAGNLIPVFCLEVLPGDTFSINMTAFVRVSTVLFPIMDNMDLESWFFYVPCRILWSHWVNFMGEQPSTPSDSISYTIPTISVTNGIGAETLFDYFGVPTAQLTGAQCVVNALPFRAYNIIWSQWFRDQNLQNALGTGATNTVGDIGDGPDIAANYTNLAPLGKRHDYFTSCLPWALKGGASVTFLSGQAIVKTNATPLYTGTENAMQLLTTAGANMTTNLALSTGAGGAGGFISQSATATTGAYTGLYPSNLYADLSTNAQATIASLRLAFQTQKLLERDARGGTRFQEVVLNHFGVRGLDFRFQRPEYQGGGKTPINMAPVPQTSQTGLTGGTTPLGTLAAVGTAVAHGHGMRGSYTEHGYIIGLVGVRADEVYQQGLHRMWTRSTRYDFYWPVFAMLGEQGVRNDEICVTGTLATDTAVFGFQERWAEYRYLPSRTSGYFRSTNPTPLDGWHLAVKLTPTPPALNAAFIQSPLSGTLARNLAIGGSTPNQQFLCDLFFDVKAARPMPLYSVPGLVDHF